MERKTRYSVGRLKKSCVVKWELSVNEGHTQAEGHDGRMIDVFLVNVG